MSILLYFLFILPYRLGFSIEPKGGEVVLDFVIDLLLMLDIFVNMNAYAALPPCASACMARATSRRAPLTNWRKLTPNRKKRRYYFDRSTGVMVTDPKRIRSQCASCAYRVVDVVTHSAMAFESADLWAAVPLLVGAGMPNASRVF